MYENQKNRQYKHPPPPKKNIVSKIKVGYLNVKPNFKITL